MQDERIRELVDLKTYLELAIIKSEKEEERLVKLTKKLEEEILEKKVTMIAKDK